MAFKPGSLSIQEANQLNELARDVANLKNLRVQEGSGITLERPSNANMVIGFDRTIAAAQLPENCVQWDGTPLVAATGSDVAYYGGYEYRFLSGLWHSYDAIRIINTAKFPLTAPKTSKYYPATFVGYDSTGTVKCYAIVTRKTTVVTGATLACSSGSVLITLSTTDLDVDEY